MAGTLLPQIAYAAPHSSSEDDEKGVVDNLPAGKTDTGTSRRWSSSR
ncbi:hypothetical protein [Streptomyces sp. NPDC050428]